MQLNFQKLSKAIIPSVKSLLIALSILLISLSVSAKIYLDQNEFIYLTDRMLTENEQEIEWEDKTLWLNADIQKRVKAILNHNYPKLRLRYKLKKNKKNVDTPKNAISIFF